MSKPSWTAEQTTAIQMRGQILVAAAAGSGKTAVLVERLIQQITHAENPVDVDRFLVVTFTKAAANEMLERVGKAIEERMFQEHDLVQMEHLLHQRVLLQKAKITTLHSFCLELIRKHFYQLELDPGFRVADQAEINLLRQDVVEALFEDRYAQNDQSFLRLIDAFGSDRDDLAVMEHTLRIFEFAQSQPEPSLWLGSLDRAYAWDSLETLMQSKWGKTLRQELGDSIQEVSGLLGTAGQIARQPQGPNHYSDTLQDDLERVHLLSRVISTGSWSEIEQEYQQTIQFPKLSGKHSNADKQLQEQCKKLRDEAKKKILSLYDELFAYPAEQQIAALNTMKGIVHTIAELVLEFSQNYAETKRQRNVVDFSDLEHFALKILADQDQPSAVAQGLKEYFAEVLVDEYQDINPVQERILQLVSRDGDQANLFMVGDVKQSIYRFRMADPGLFLKKYHELPHWHPELALPEAGLPKVVIDLNKNFRSRREVVDGVNFVFRQIMTNASGEISYDDHAALQYGASYVQGQESLRTAEGPIEVHLLDLKSLKDTLASVTDLNSEPNSNSLDDALPKNESGADPTEDSDSNPEFSREEFDKARLEAHFVSRRIRAMVEGAEFQIYDQKLGDFRPICYSDIVILMRSYSAVAPVYVEEFQNAGIPVYAETATGYFGASEVETMVSLLKVLDNPHQDIPLAAVLRSPLAGLNGSELGKLRMFLPEGDFYETLALGALACLSLDEETPADEGTLNNREGSEPDCEITDGLADKQKDLLRILAFYAESLPERLKRAGKVLTATPELKETIQKFWDQLQVWRTRSRQMSLADLLWSLYEDSGYMVYVGTLPAGVQRQANLKVLYDRAKRFEATRYRGLFRFLRFLERFQDQGHDLGNARILGENEDVVRLMTVHASKGLEFPVVFVVGLGRSFNSQSQKAKLLLHSDLGLGLPIIDVENNVQYPSLIQTAVRRKLNQESLAEELRILYVALTRAKERLFLYGNADNIENSLQKWQRVSDWQSVSLPDAQLRSAKSFLDWLGPALVRHPSLNPKYNGGEEFSLPDLNSSWEVYIHNSFATGTEENLKAENETTIGDTAAGQEANVEVQVNQVAIEPEVQEEADKSFDENTSQEAWAEEVDRRLGWIYPAPVSYVAKTSVSELKRQHNWHTDEEAGVFAYSGMLTEAEDLRPKFLQAAKPLTAAERGTALHTVMQHLPFEEWGQKWAALTPADQITEIRGFLNRLQSREILSPEQLTVIEPRQILSFLNSELSQRFFKSDQILREVPFTLTIPLPNQAGKNILVQGVIDVVMISQGKEGASAELLDYKTDSFRENNEKAPDILIERYALQLALYASAIERLLGIKVDQCTLYSFSLGTEIIIPESKLAEAQESLVKQLSKNR